MSHEWSLAAPHLHSEWFVGNSADQDHADPRSLVSTPHALSHSMENVLDTLVLRWQQVASERLRDRSSTHEGGSDARIERE